jgi:glutamyl-tRNA synthetase
MILRIEDTDRSRFVEDAEQDILNALKWAGLSFDEGPGQGGESGPYRQSERSARYGEIVTQLLDSNSAYIAFDSPAEIEEMRNRMRTSLNPNPRYDASTRMSMLNSLSLTKNEVSERLVRGDPHVVRLLVEPGSTVTFTDLVRGQVSFETDVIDDQVLAKSDGYPTYHLANVIDDHDMQITHVIRGEEWLSSTPKHVLLYRALDWTTPVMAHLPLILSPTGGKLSKRSADKAGIRVSVRDYIELGYEPEALINFLVLLGWNPGDETEFFDMPELIRRFSLDRIGHSGTQFDMDKLKWFNEQHLRRRPAVDIAADVIPLLEKNDLPYTTESLVAAIELMRERISFRSDLLECEYLFEDPKSYDQKGVKKRWKGDTPALLEEYADALESESELDPALFETHLRAIAERHEIGAGQLIHPVRLAVSGLTFGPGLFDLLDYLGRDAVVRRIRKAVSLLP